MAVKDIVGTCIFEATYPTTGKTTEITALVAKDTRDSLISWHDLIELGWELKHQLRAMQTSDTASQVSMSKLMKQFDICLLYTSPSPRDLSTSRMPSSA